MGLLTQATREARMPLSAGSLISRPSLVQALAAPASDRTAASVAQAPEIGFQKERRNPPREVLSAERPAGEPKTVQSRDPRPPFAKARDRIAASSAKAAGNDPLTTGRRRTPPVTDEVTRGEITELVIRSRAERQSDPRRSRQLTGGSALSGILSTSAGRAASGAAPAPPQRKGLQQNSAIAVASVLDRKTARSASVEALPAQPDQSTERGSQRQALRRPSISRAAAGKPAAVDLAGPSPPLQPVQSIRGAGPVQQPAHISPRREHGQAEGQGHTGEELPLQASLAEAPARRQSAKNPRPVALTAPATVVEPDQSAPLLPPFQPAKSSPMPPLGVDWSAPNYPAEHRAAPARPPAEAAPPAEPAQSVETAPPAQPAKPLGSDDGQALAEDNPPPVRPALVGRAHTPSSRSGIWPLPFPPADRTTSAESNGGKPEVRIGRVEVVVASPGPPARPASSPAPANFTSRRYLRRV